MATRGGPSDATVLVSYLVEAPQGDCSQLLPYRPNVCNRQKWVQGEGQSRPQSKTPIPPSSNSITPQFYSELASRGRKAWYGVQGSGFRFRTSGIMLNRVGFRVQGWGEGSGRGVHLSFAPQTALSPRARARPRLSATTDWACPLALMSAKLAESASPKDRCTAGCPPPPHHFPQNYNRQGREAAGRAGRQRDLTVVAR